MPDDLKTEVDLEGLTVFASKLFGVLEGTGQTGDVHQFVRTEAGQLAGDIANLMGPKSLAGATRRIDRDMRQHLTTKPARMNLNQSSEKYAEFTWLYASPHFVLGINDEDNQVRAGLAKARLFLRAGQRSADRGDAYQELGFRTMNRTNVKSRQRGKQRFMRLNRVRISPATFSALKQELTAKVGQLRASFAYTASKLIPNKRVPTWIARQFPSQAGGKAIYDATGLADTVAPFIIFGSSAKGVESNPMIVDKMARAVERRKYIMRQKINQILRGYSYDWNTGRVFRPQVPAEGLPE